MDVNGWEVLSHILLEKNESKNLFITFTFICFSHPSQKRKRKKLGLHV